MIGILALHGGVEEHESILDQLGLAHKRVRHPEHAKECSGLILPGGESTVMNQFMGAYGWDTFLRHFTGPVLGTCAGLILLAQHGLIDIELLRNAYGRQQESFITTVSVKDLGPLEAHFIRAPKIMEVSEGVHVLAEYEGAPVLVRSGQYWGASFHPELAGDPKLHALIFS